MLGRDAAAGATLRAHDEGHAAVAARHQAELGGLVDQHVHAEHGEVHIEDFDDGAGARDGSTHTDADHAGFGDGRVAHALGAVLAEQAFSDLVGAAAFGNALADDEDQRVRRHFLVDRLAERVAVHDFACHCSYSLLRAQ